LSPLISLEDFHHGEQLQKGMAELPLAVTRALEKDDWPLVKELSQSADAAQQAMSEGADRFETARHVHAVVCTTSSGSAATTPTTGDCRSGRISRRRALAV
jgi:hypothetical protein